MRVAVAGGTGVVGSYVVTALRQAGHTPVVLARAVGVDLLSGTGLDAALNGAEAVVDVTNVTTTRRSVATRFFETTTGNLLAAGRRAGVGHHVVLSIVGVDRVEFGYYQGKLRQEALALAGPVPATVLRATQFHEFAGQLLARTRGPVAFAPRMTICPVAAREVGNELARLVTHDPQGLAADMAGPEQHELASLARQVVRASGRRRAVVGVRLPGRAGAAMAGGALLPTGPVTRGTQTFEQWLRQPAAASG